MTDPWYAQGLPFDCTRCGNCCRGSGFVLVTDGDLQRLVDRLGLSADAVRRQFCVTRTVETGPGSPGPPRPRAVLTLKVRREEGRPCVFLQPDDTCRVHGDAPVQCRTYPAWPEVLESPASYFGEADRCPAILEGCDRGTLIPVEELTARLAELRAGR